MVNISNKAKIIFKKPKYGFHGSPWQNEMFFLRNNNYTAAEKRRI